MDMAAPTGRGVWVVAVRDCACARRARAVCAFAAHPPPPRSLLQVRAHAQAICIGRIANVVCACHLCTSPPGYVTVLVSNCPERGKTYNEGSGCSKAGAVERRNAA